MSGLGWRLNRTDTLVLSEMVFLNPEPTGRKCPNCGENSVRIANEDEGVNWTDGTHYTLLLRCHACGVLIKETWRTDGV